MPSRELLFEDPASSAPPWPESSPPVVVLLAALLTTLVSAGLCAAAILAPAPSAVVPLVVVICIGCPLLASWRVPQILVRLRVERISHRALAQLQRSLAQLPDGEHPLGHDG
jgi:hypothetical protein